MKNFNKTQRTCHKQGPVNHPCPNLENILGLNSVIAALQNPKRKLEKLIVVKSVYEKLKHLVPAKLLVEILEKPDFCRVLPKYIRDTSPHTQDQGVLLLAHPYYDKHDIKNLTHGHVVVLDRVEDVNNLGAIVRLCAAFEVNNIIIPTDNSAKINSTVYKISSGALEFVKVFYVTNLVRTIGELKKNNFWVLGFAEYDREFATNNPAIDFVDICSALNSNKNNKLTLVLGGESHGLRHLTKKNCDTLVYIPTGKDFLCLNVSHAMAVIFGAMLQNKTSTLVKN